MNLTYLSKPACYMPALKCLQLPAYMLMHVAAILQCQDAEKQQWHHVSFD